ncbi:uncharacterized protein [Dermacentor andersoni]|uniref:uncharacterized protein isoform X2 n=1 Tax=Dermacentor andersoni TaxID=34620 RepID=UPI003B3AA148
MSLRPYYPIPSNTLELREKTISFNGVHILFKMGRRETIPESHVKGFDGFSFRTFAITLTLEKRFSVGASHDAAYATTELVQGMPRHYNKTNSATDPSFSDYTAGQTATDEYFSLALRFGTENSSHIWNYFFETKLSGVDMDYTDARLWIYCPEEKYILTSVHFYDLSGPDPNNKHRFESLAKQQVQLSPGTFTFCIGVHTGKDPIQVIKGNKNENLGKPPRSQVTITIQVTISRVIFVTNYDTVVSIADTSGGMPEFSNNFIMKRIVHELNY